MQTGSDISQDRKVIDEEMGGQGRTPSFVRVERQSWPDDVGAVTDPIPMIRHTTAVSQGDEQIPWERSMMTALNFNPSPVMVMTDDDPGAGTGHRHPRAVGPLQSLEEGLQGEPVSPLDHPYRNGSHVARKATFMGE
jgi:hypothetical protein